MSLDLTPFADSALFFLRLMVGLVLFREGYRDAMHSAPRSAGRKAPRAGIGLLGVAQMAGGVAVIAGILPQVAAAALLVVLAGAISMKIFVSRTGFWGENGGGWNYDLVVASMLVVVLVTDGGRFVLLE
jgi:putative oxidoreductase